MHRLTVGQATLRCPSLNLNLLVEVEHYAAFLRLRRMEVSRGDHALTMHEITVIDFLRVTAARAPLLRINTAFVVDMSFAILDMSCADDGTRVVLNPQRVGCVVSGARPVRILPPQVVLRGVRAAVNPTNI